MTSLTTFYLSGITGKEVFGSDGDVIGVIRDLMVNAVPSGQNDPNQQMITGIKLKDRKGDKAVFLHYLQGCQGTREHQRDMLRPY
jgi:sporulation protein YlmC with PRC-barrel domain